MKKYFLFLLLIGLLVSCKTKNAKVPVETQPTTPPQWLTLKGETNKPNIVLVSGDEEYRSEEALPQLAKILSQHHGFNCTVLFAQHPEKPGLIDPNYLHNIPGLEKLEEADMMVIFTRFRALPDEQMQHIDNYLKSGKPVLGIRTATHAFNFKEDFPSAFAHYGNYHESEDEWNDGFGRLVLGEKWISHHGHHKHQSTRGIPASGVENHPIWNGIESGEIWGPTDVYGVRMPLPGDSQPIVLGQVINRPGDFDENDNLYGMRSSDTEIATDNPAIKDKEKKYNPNNPLMPIAWTKSYQLPAGKKGKVFATTIGSSTDLLSEGTRRMMINAVFWCLDQPVPQKANVSLVGNYQPDPYAFVKEDHWVKKDMHVKDLISE